jgi:outer membrane protein
MRRIFAGISFLMMLTFVSASVFAAEGAKLGYVDVQKILNQSSSGKEAKDQLTAKVKKYQDEINKKQEELKKLKDVIEKQGHVLSESARNSKEKEYQQLLKDLQRLQKDAQDDLQAEDERLTRAILGNIEKVVQDYGRKNGYSFIFIRNDSMIYADDKADLTDQVLALVNAAKK